jgi:hypothetical protein
VPCAPFCILCQELEDRRHDHGDELFHEMLVDAA